MAFHLGKVPWEMYCSQVGPIGTRFRLDEWAKTYGSESPEWADCEIGLCSWSSSEIEQALLAASEYQPRLMEDMVNGVNNATLPPRMDGLPLVLARFPGDRYGWVDGKHRANKWIKAPGMYAVYVLEASC